MSTPALSDILGIDLREGLPHGLLYITVGDEVETMAHEEHNGVVKDDGIRWVESITIDSAWVVVRTNLSPSFAIPLADVVRVWFR